MASEVKSWEYLPLTHDGREIEDGGLETKASRSKWHIKRRARLFFVGLFAVFGLFLIEGENLLHGLHESGNGHKASTSGVPASDANFICRTRRLETYNSTEGNQKRKVYDLFLIDTEMDWLEIRLGELFDVVDYFIIMESPVTFSGNSKPLNLKNNWKRFDRWHSKMRLFTLLNVNLTSSNWDRESHARNALLTQALHSLQGEEAPHDNDVLLVADVDEVPRPEILKALRLCDIPPVVTLDSTFYFYSYQWRVRGGWNHPQATVYNGIKTLSPEKLRMGNKGFIIRNAAWHCSNCFPKMDQMVHKLESYSHQEVNRAELKTEKWIINSYRYGTDIYNRPRRYDRIDYNTDVPSYVLAHSKRFAYLIDRDPLGANFVDASPAAFS